ncbi:MAG: ABC transporter ATP-binding protein [Clostridiales bacterium]|nr:ABC transporter ATP-binding protein [Clostridiales bacterium]
MKIKNFVFYNFYQSLQELWAFDKRLVFTLIVDVIVGAISPFPNIIISGRLVDSIASSESFDTIVFWVLLLFTTNFIILVFNNLFNNIKSYLLIKLSNKFDYDVSKKCLDLDFEQFNEPALQDRIQMVNQAVRGNNYYTSVRTIFLIASQILTIIGIVSVMSTLNYWLFIIATIVLVLQSALFYFRVKRDRRFVEESANDRRKNNYVSSLAKNIQCKKDIDMFGASNYILRKTEECQKSILSLEKQHIKDSSCFDIFASFFSIAFQISAYLILGFEAFNNYITIGDFTTGVASLISFMSASSFLTSSIIGYNDNVFYIKQFKSFCKLRSKFDVTSSMMSLNDIDVNNITIEFRNVSFRYPNSTAYVLKNINLKISNSERLGIVGYNGAGKTTLILLLIRMYDPTEGAIYINGVDIKNIKYSDYQRLISSVNQDFSLMSFSIIENVIMDDNISDDIKNEVLTLLEKNGLGERIKKLYRGLNTPISKELFASGVDFSGGEMQRIAITRAQYKKSPIFILDEPTSALDPQAESELFKKFTDMSEGKTTILVSHRIYSTRFCDKIAVLDKGELKEYGTFDELMQKKGMYYDLFERQAEYFK